MAEAIAEPAITAPGNTGFAVIPKGRENDYWELSAPSADFLDMKIDRGNMYVAPLLITNGSEDRDGEVTNPDGLIEAAYKINPMVFLQHSHRIDPMLPPVGTAETPDRKYDVQRRSDGWYSGCRFTQATKMARQVFRLVDDGVLRGRSIGALNHALAPYKPKLPGVAFHNNAIVPVRTKSVSHEKYELIEWSWVWMPANRDIVTPQRMNTPSREVVPMIKGILSLNRLDDTPLDPGLKLIMKSLNLAEPAMAVYHKAKVWPFQSGANAVSEPTGTPFEILFSAKSYTPADAKKYLASCSDIGLLDTNLSAEIKNGETFLKSVQYEFKGPTIDVENPEVPGMILRFIKAVSPNEQVEAEVKEVEPDNDDVVDVDAAMKPAAEQSQQTQDVSGETTSGETVVNAESDAVVKPEKPGLKYLKALIKQATEMADQAEAAQEEQEPEMMEKCQQFTSDLRTFIGKVAEFQKERYGHPDFEESMDEKPETALLEKSVKADLFYGRKVVLPPAFSRGLNALHDMATDEKQKQLAGAMLKGVIAKIVPETKTSTADTEREALKARLVERLKRRSVQQLT